VTSALIELTGLADAVPDQTVLDGEVVADGGRGADFYKVGPSAAARQPEVRLAFVAFDVPYLAGESTLGLTYRERRGLLEQLELDGPAWCTMAVFYEDASDVLAECARLQLEGLVAKRMDSRYEPGKRSASWRKLKCADRRDRDAPLRHER
jgi:bifunctional non-homologous end joining protein LigD